MKEVRRSAICAPREICSDGFSLLLLFFPLQLPLKARLGRHEPEASTSHNRLNFVRIGARRLRRGRETRTKQCTGPLRRRDLVNEADAANVCRPLRCLIDSLFGAEDGVRRRSGQCVASVRTEIELEKVSAR